MFRRDLARVPLGLRRVVRDTAHIGCETLLAVDPTRAAFNTRHQTVQVIDHEPRLKRMGALQSGPVKRRQPAARTA